MKNLQTNLQTKPAQLLPSELLHQTFARFVIVSGCVYGAWHFAATLSQPEVYLVDSWRITPVVALVAALSLWLAQGQLWLAQTVWQVGAAAAIGLALHVYGQAEIAFLLVLLPFFAATIAGWRGGLLSVTLVTICVWVEPFAFGLPVGYRWAVAAASLLVALLSYISVQALLTMTAWSLYNAEQARLHLEQARRHRAETLHALKQLDLANYQLARANHTMVLARAEAEAARNDRDRFALAVSHELRTPLNFIFGFSELMVNAPETYAKLDEWPDGLHDDINEIYRSCRHLLRLINDILELGKIEARQMLLFKESTQMAEIVREVEGMVRPAFERKRLWLRTEIDPDLPPLTLDRTRIRQVLLNLLTNSLRFTEQGGVVVRAKYGPEAMTVSVEDTGPGIADADLPKVFEEFRQVGEGGWRRDEGTGLGMAISQNFIRLHGGQIGVESAAGRGARFYFTLPLPAATPSALPTQLPTSPTLDKRQSTERFWQGLTQRSARERLLLVLTQEPAASKPIVDGLDGVKTLMLDEAAALPSAVQHHLPSLLVVDRALCDEETLPALRAQLPYALPIISANLSNMTATAELPPNVKHYLVKPVTRQALGAAVHSLGATNVLVVDDDPAMVRFVKLALGSERSGSVNGAGEVRLRSALTGSDALAQLRAQPPDVVLLDLVLPDVGGWEILAQMQGDAALSQVPVVLLTANDLPQPHAEQRDEALHVQLNRALSRRELGTMLQSLVVEQTKFDGCGGHRTGTP